MALTTSLTTLASKATPRNGFGGASAVWPALSSSRITPANPDASAKAPWTRTTVGPGTGFSSGLERWPQRRYVTGPERIGPGVRRPAHDRLFCAAQPPCDHHLHAARVGREAASGLGQALGPSPATRLPIANVHADRHISMCKSNVRSSCMSGKHPAGEADDALRAKGWSTAFQREGTVSLPDRLPRDNFALRDFTTPPQIAPK